MQVKLPTLALFCIALSSCASNRISEPEPASGASARVSEKLTLDINGVDLKIILKGASEDLPVLLFIHGGPGVPELPVAPVNRALQEDFIVVNYDQRGAGRSFAGPIPTDEMRVRNFVDDAIDLSEYLVKRFDRKKIYLVGFSFGSLVGAQAAAERPDLYAAYIGLSQFVTVPESERILDVEGRARARSAGDTEALERLREIGPPPYPDHHVETEFNTITAKIADDLGAVRYKERDYISAVLRSKYYRLSGGLRLKSGGEFSKKALESQLYKIDLRKLVKRIDVPVYMAGGRYDTILSQTLAKRYLDSLRAPKGKRWFWFEKASHAVHLESPAEYQALMRQVKKDHAADR